MDFRELTYLQAIAKHQNITKAANTVFVSQPTLTKFLQKTEKELGLKLFKRLGNRYCLTYAGELYLEKATAILSLKKQLDAEMNDIIKKDRGVLNLASGVMRCSYLLPSTLPAFQAQFPNVRVKVQEANSDRLEAMLLSGETDLAFFDLPAVSPDLDYEVINQEELLLVMSPANPLARKAVPHKNSPHPWLDMHYLEKERFILQTTGQRTEQNVEALLKNCDFIPTVVLRTGSLPAAAELAAANYGICFMTDTHLQHIHTKQPLAYFSIGQPRILVDFVAAWRRGVYLPAYAKTYIEIAKQAEKKTASRLS